MADTSIRDQARRRRRMKDGAVLALTGLSLAVILFPVWWILVTSFEAPGEVFSDDLRFWPAQPHLENYREVLRGPFLRYLGNSVIIALPAVLIAVVLAVPAAYAFSRMRFRGRKLLLVGVVVTQVFPFIVLVTPLYALFVEFQLLNTRGGLLLAYTAISLPLCIYMLLGFLDGVPKELDEAASLDGAGVGRTLVSVIVPAALPGIGAVSIFAFTIAWNEFLLALTLLTRDELLTAQVGLAAMFGEFGADWGLVMAASMLVTVPAFLIFFFLQKQLVSGITQGAVK